MAVTNTGTHASANINNVDCSLTRTEGKLQVGSSSYDNLIEDTQTKSFNEFNRPKKESVESRPESISEECIEAADAASPVVPVSRSSAERPYNAADAIVPSDDEQCHTEVLRSVSGEACQPVTPLKCKLINASHRGSLDCLSTSPASFGQSHRRDASQHKSWGRSPHGDGSYSTGCQKSKPSPVPRSLVQNASSNPSTPKTPSHDLLTYTFSTPPSAGQSFGSSRPSSVERLKRTGNYRPVILKSREPMKTAFVMGLDHTDPYKSSPMSSTSSTSGMGTFNNTPNSSSLSSCAFSPTGAVRPQVPPRTKFLSPSEHSVTSASVVSGNASLQTSSGAAEAAAALLQRCNKAGQLCNLDISQQQQLEELDQPRTPLKVSTAQWWLQHLNGSISATRETKECNAPSPPDQVMHTFVWFKFVFPL